MSSNKQLVRTYDWLEEQIRLTDYGEVSIKVILHDGQIRNIEQNILSKYKPEVSAKEAQTPKHALYNNRI